MNKWWVGTILWLLASFGYAQSFCFLSASSYYEQVYCELQAKGEARGLPPFHQFKRNDENIQATLLKRPAARIGIDLPMPRKATPSVVLPEPLAQHRPVAQNKPSVQNQPSSDANPGQNAVADCALADGQIRCGETRYSLVGNRLNHRLAEDALGAGNLMALPRYTGDLGDAQAVNRYLSGAYTRYIEKMHDIGLAGATLTYTKFVFLFYDVQAKGLNFSDRFETMYGFLKKDKASMGVSEKVSPDQALTPADCSPLSDKMLVCQRAGRNYLYLAVSSQ